MSDSFDIEQKLTALFESPTWICAGMIIAIFGAFINVSRIPDPYGNGCVIIFLLMLIIIEPYFPAYFLIFILYEIIWKPTAFLVKRARRPLGCIGITTLAVACAVVVDVEALLRKIVALHCTSDTGMNNPYCRRSCTAESAKNEATCNVACGVYCSHQDKTCQFSTWNHENDNAFPKYLIIINYVAFVVWALCFIFWKVVNFKKNGDTKKKSDTNEHENNILSSNTATNSSVTDSVPPQNTAINTSSMKLYKPIQGDDLHMSSSTTDIRENDVNKGSMISSSLNDKKRKNSSSPTESNNKRMHIMKVRKRKEQSPSSNQAADRNSEMKPGKKLKSN
jgi:hypothetical protein